MARTGPESVRLLLFALDSLRLALPVEAVERALRAVEITPLPGAPRIVAGVVNMAGRIVPVLDLRPRFGLAPRELAPDDALLVVHGVQRTLLVIADEVHGIAEYPAAALVPAAEVVAGLEHVRGMVRLEDGVLLINEPDRFLDLEQARLLELALDAERAA